MAAPAPPKCDPRLESQVPAVPVAAAGASIVAPATDAERLAVALHLTWVADLVDTVVQLRDRALLAKAECEARR